MADFIEDWRAAASPLLIVDEIRPDGNATGEQLVSTVFLETDTRTAVRWAESALTIRDELAPTARETCFKGRTLYGSRQRRSHEPMRNYVRAALRECRSGFLVTTSNHVLRGHESARGGIRPVPATDQDRLLVNEVRGPELVPLLNSIKVIAVRRNLGHVQIDVLVDRSKQIGLDHNVIGVPKDTIQVFGPGKLNATSDGSPSSLISHSRFRIIATPEEGRLRDLLLLPDAVAYQVQLRGLRDAAKAALASGTEFWIEDIHLNSLLPPSPVSTRRPHLDAKTAAKKRRR